MPESWGPGAPRPPSGLPAGSRTAPHEAGGAGPLGHRRAARWPSASSPSLAGNARLRLVERSGPPWPISAAGDRSSGRATGQHDDRSVALHRRQQRSLKRGRAAGRSPPRSHPGRSGFRSRPLTERALRPVALALPPTAAHGGEGPQRGQADGEGAPGPPGALGGRACESPRRRRRPAHALARRAQRTAGHAPKITDRGLRRLDRASDRGRLTGVGRVGTTEDVSAVDSPELDLDGGPVVRGALDAPLRADLLQRSGRPPRRSRRDRAAPVRAYGSSEVK